MAKKTSQPAAAAVKQITRITVGGTWAGGDTLSFAVGGSTLTITLANASSTSTIAQAIEAAWNASNRDYVKIDDETVNLGGQEANELAEIKAVWETTNSYVDLEGVTPGKPFTVTESETSAAGTLTPSTLQAATGTNHWDNVENWDTGTVPVAAVDDVIISSNTWFKYNLPQASFDPLSVTVYGNLGLPDMNRDNPARPYPEYRNKDLKLADSNVTTDTIDIIVGRGPGIGPTFASIDNVDEQQNVVVYGTGQPFDPDQAAFICGGTLAVETWRIVSGNVKVNSVQASEMKIGRLGGPNDAIVDCRDCTVGAVTPLVVYSGVVEVGDMSTLIEVYGGQCGITGMNNSGNGTIKVYNDGILYFGTSSAGETLISITAAHGGTIDTTRARSTITMTANFAFYKGGRLIDPQRRIVFQDAAEGFAFTECGVGDVDLDVGVHYIFEPQTL